MPEDFYDSIWGATYSAYMERPRLSRAISRVVWGGDTAPYHDGMASIRELARDSTVVDCPCGAGPALRALPGDGSIRYIGVDLSPAMLRRARKRGVARGLRHLGLLEADAADLPLPTSSADLFLSFWGLHCFADPRAALHEAARVLKPGGHLVGSSFLRGADTLRQRLLVRPHVGDFGPICTQQEIEAWLSQANLELTSVQRSGPMLFFGAAMPGR